MHAIMLDAMRCLAAQASAALATSMVPHSQASWHARWSTPWRCCHAREDLNSSPYICRRTDVYVTKYTRCTGPLRST